MAAELAMNNTKLEKPTIEQIKLSKNGKYIIKTKKINSLKFLKYPLYFLLS
jgi:hypothetical protein